MKEREELKEILENLDCYPEIREELQDYLSHYVQSLDLEMVAALLEGGCNPNPKDNLHCFIHLLLHEYIAVKTSSGMAVLEMLEMLLMHGANPNRVWSNNQRAYDYAVAWDIKPVANLLKRFGADSELREPM